MKKERINKLKGYIFLVAAFVLLLIVSGCSGEFTLEDAMNAVDEMEGILEEVEGFEDEWQGAERFEDGWQDAEQFEDSSQDSNQSYDGNESDISEVTVDGKMAVHFLDVGQGLSILVQCDGQTLIYDGGDRDTSSHVVTYLKNMGVETIDYLISSHYDSDHVAGLIGCLYAFDVKNVISADYVHDSKTYESFISRVEELGLTMQHPAVGTEYTFGSGKFVILAPETIIKNDSNENSVVIKLIHGENSFIFTGDAEHKSEEAMCSSGLNLECDVLVAGHHGSATATSWEFLQYTVPKYAVISCGQGNSYGHPHADTMEKLEAMEIDVYRTDKQGWISVVSDGTTMSWSQEPCNDYSAGEEE